jgi:transcriptional regulator with XRE-family HTH domain
VGTSFRKGSCSNDKLERDDDSKKSHPALAERFPQALRMRRKMLGMSQEKLGEAFGISFQQVQKYEKGANRISASRLQRAADVLGVAVPFFFEGTPDTQVPGYAESLPGHIDEFVSSRDGLRLIKAFAQIDNDEMRRSIVGLIQEIALRDGRKQE